MGDAGRYKAPRPKYLAEEGGTRVQAADPGRWAWGVLGAAAPWTVPRA